MKQSMMKTFRISLVTTVVFYGYLISGLMVAPEPSWVLLVLAIFFVYAPLFGSLFALNTIKAHKYVTFRYGAISVISKWGLMYLAVIGLDVGLPVIYIVFILSFLIALAADIGMFLRIKKTDEAEMKHKMIKDKPKLSQKALTEKELVLKYLTLVIIILTATAIVLVRTNELVDVLFHAVLWVFIVKMLLTVKRHGVLRYAFHYVVIYVVLMYALVSLILWFLQPTDSAIVLLPFAYLIYAPIVNAYFNVSMVIQKYKDAASIES